jgi:hypothetical protein
MTPSFKKIKDADWSTKIMPRDINKSLTHSNKSFTSFWFDNHEDTMKSIVIVTIGSEYYIEDSAFLPVLTNTHFEVNESLFFSDITSFWYINLFAELVSIARQRNIAIAKSICNDDNIIELQTFPTTALEKIVEELKENRFFQRPTLDK